MASSVLINEGNWSDKTRANPAMKWMEYYTREIIDTRSWEKDVPASKYHTADFKLQFPGGKVTVGDPWKGLTEIYGPFAAHKHVPTWLICFETKDGWGMMGSADLFFKVHAPLNETVTDPEGDKWQGVAKGAFWFEYVKEGETIKLKETRIFSDPSPAMKLMLENKMIDGPTLAGIVIGS